MTAARKPKAPTAADLDASSGRQGVPSCLALGCIPTAAQLRLQPTAAHNAVSVQSPAKILFQGTVSSELRARLPNLRPLIAKLATSLGNLVRTIEGSTFALNGRGLGRRTLSSEEPFLAIIEFRISFATALAKCALTDTEQEVSLTGPGNLHINGV